MTILVASAGCLTTSAHAQLQGPFWYLGIQGGAFEVTESTYGVKFRLPELSPLESIPGFSVYDEADFDVGFAVGGLIGRQLTPWFALEAEYTYREADVGPADDLETLSTNAFFGNLVFRLPTSKLVEPYVAVGAGYISNDWFYVSEEDGNNGAAAEDNFGGSFAVQAKGGIDWYLTDRLSLGIEGNWHRGFDASTDFDNEPSATAFFEIGGVTASVTIKRRF